MPNAKSRQNVCLVAHVWQVLTSIVCTTHNHRVAGLRLSGEESLTYEVKVLDMPPTPLNCALAQWWDNAVTHFLREGLKIVEVTYVAANGARPSKEMCCTQPGAGPRRPWRGQHRRLGHNCASAPTQKAVAQLAWQKVSRIRCTPPMIAAKPNSLGMRLRSEELPRRTAPCLESGLLDIDCWPD